MARFYATVTNGRGNETPVGGRSSVNGAHVRGWDVGVKLTTNQGLTGPDEITVYLTGGSHNDGKVLEIGTATLTPDGPVFTPSAALIASDDFGDA